MRLILFYSPFHGFVHKTLVAAHECGLWDKLWRVPTFPFKNLDGETVGADYRIDALNPLGKVPTLIDEGGRALFGSQLICEYLDDRAPGTRLFPAAGPARWDALTRQTIGDGLFELTVQIGMEQWRPPAEQRRDLFAWLAPKIDAALATLDAQARGGWPGFDIGHAAMLQGLSYLAARTTHWDGSHIVDAPHPWRTAYPDLARWYDAAIARPSVRSHFGVPFAGDTSPAQHRAAIAEAIRRRAPAEGA